MTRRRCFRAEVFILLAFLPAVVRADRGEWRIGVAASGISARFEDSGSEAAALVPGGLVRVTFGLTNALDLGARLDVHYAPTVELRDANVAGDKGRLFASVLTPTVALEARFVAGVDVSRLFWRTHPVLAARLGILGIRYAGRILLDDMNRLVEGYAATIDVTPLVGLDVGVEHRFGRRLIGGVATTAELARGYRAIGLHLELSWLWY